MGCSLDLLHRAGRRGLRQQEARLDVRDHDRRIPERVLDDGQTVPLVGQRQDGVRVGVIDVRRRQEGVDQRLDGRVGAARVEQRTADLVHHRTVVQRVQGLQAKQRAEIERGMARRLDRRHVEPRRLHEDGGRLASRHGSPRGLHRRVAAAVQDKRGLAPKQPARVGPQRERFSPHRPVGLDGTPPAIIPDYPDDCSGV